MDLIIFSTEEKWLLTADEIMHDYRTLPTVSRFKADQSGYTSWWTDKKHL